MVGASDPLGMPLSTDVVSGERADDGLYIPILERMRRGLHRTGLLFVGDGKRLSGNLFALLQRDQAAF